MNDPALAVVSMLTTAGLGTFGGTAAFSLFVGSWPEAPSACVLINATGGLPPEPRLLLNYPSVQVVVRGAPSGYVAARNKMTQIVNALIGLVPGVISGDTYRGCIQIGEVATLGQDDKTRQLFSANFRFFVEPAAIPGGHRVAIS